MDKTNSASRILKSDLTRDIAMAVVLSCAVALSVLLVFRSLLGEITQWSAYNFWFDGDPPLVYLNMVNRSMTATITKHHPLFQLLTHPLIAISAPLIGAARAVGLFIAGVGGLCIALLFGLLRKLGLPRLDATIFALLGAVSASTIFWFSIPETLSFGALSIMVPILLVKRDSGPAPHPTWWYLGASCLSLAVTLTHWMSGVAMLFANFKLKRAALLAGASFGVVLVLSLVQLSIFPHAKVFIPPESHSGNFVLHPDAGGPVTISQSFFISSMVMPHIEERYRESVRVEGHLGVQGTPLGRSGPKEIAGITLWLALLVTGAAGWWQMVRRSRQVAVLSVVLLGQLSLHLVYGVETFFYSPAWILLLVAFSSLGTRTRFRRLSRGMACLAIPVIFWNNAEQFVEAKRLLGQNAASTVGAPVVVPEPER